MAEITAETAASVATKLARWLASLDADERALAWRLIDVAAAGIAASAEGGDAAGFALSTAMSSPTNAFGYAQVLRPPSLPNTQASPEAAYEFLLAQLLKLQVQGG